MHSDNPRPTRRRFLEAIGTFVGAAALPGVLSACSGPPAPQQSSGSGAGAGAKSSVKFWLTGDGAEAERFYRKQLDAFTKSSGVDVEVQFFPPPQYANALQVAFAGGDKPDVFAVAGGQGITLNEAKRRRWVSPIDDLLTADFKQRFPDWVFDPKRSWLYIDGEAYGVPLLDPAVYGLRVLYWNRDLLGEHGFSSPPATWSELRTTAEKITRDGKGKAYGTALVGTTPTHLILQNLAGPQHFRDDPEPPISLLTGKAAMSEPSLIAQIEFLQELNKAKIFTPGWENWQPQQALQQMAAGRLGMYIFPIQHAAALRRANPKLNLGIAPPPLPDGGRAGSRAPVEAGLAQYMLSANPRDQKASFELLDFLGSVEFERAAFQDMKMIPIMPAALDGVELDADTEQLRSAAKDIVRTRPNPSLKDAGANNFYRDLVTKAPRPTPPELFFEAITRGSDFRATAATYDKDLDAAMAKLAGESSFDLGAFTFPDWDPLENYS